MEKKLDALLRYHRLHAFDDGVTGERHERALRRLKATPTARAIFAARADRAAWRESERLLRLWA